MSDYEWLVELAAKGMAERDNHPMPRSVTTPEAFYEVMARAALDAVGLQALLEELAGAVQELENADRQRRGRDGAPRGAICLPPARAERAPGHTYRP
jgi:hypothetical protein